MRKPRLGEMVLVKAGDLAGEKVKVSRANSFSIWTKQDDREIELDIDDIELVERDKIDRREKSRLLHLYVEPLSLRLAEDRNREIGIFSRLLSKYPDVDFWRQFKPSFKVKSMAWWLGDGKADIEQQYNRLNLDFDPKPIIVGTKKLGESMNLPKKRSIQDWLT